MRELVFITLILPFLSWLFLALFWKRTEETVSLFSRVAATLHGIGVVTLVSLWAAGGFAPYELRLGNLYANGEYTFPLVFLFDHVSAVFLLVTCFLASLVFHYSRYYLHRDPGYPRFFACLHMLICGMTLLLLSGTLDLLFAGWEIVGISSFALIGFYWERFQPLRNAMRTYFVYRFCDVGLLLSAWLTHRFFQEAQLFSTLNQPNTLEMLRHSGQLPLFGMSALILLAASGKSAQFPFTFWLPKAMEGPTPSSAIFYGALSVHAGVYLLIRTFALWQASDWAPWLVGSIGLLTTIVATGIGRTEPNIKGQIAYASAAQVGLQFFELALGYPNLALFHFAGNACFRCYQLLVSPSVVAYLLRLQGSVSAGLDTNDWSLERVVPNRLRSTAYVFALNEGYMPAVLRGLLWRPAYLLGKLVRSLDQSFLGNVGLTLLLILSALAMFSLGVSGSHLEIVAAFLMVAASFRAIAERQMLWRTWKAVGLSSALAGAAVWLISPDSLKDVSVYLSGVFFFWAAGALAILKLQKEDSLSREGLVASVATHPVAAFLVFVAFLGVTGFPISPTFLGEDLLLHHAVGQQLWLAAAITVAFVLNGVALVAAMLTPGESS